jgi:hypothetical protein
MTPHLEAVTDLVIIAFFYLLHVGEYTTPHRARAKRTIPLRDCDIRLWYHGHIIPHSAGLRALMRADSATICIAHTKMAQKVQWCTMKRLADLSVPSQPWPAGWLTYSRQIQKIARLIQCTASLGDAPKSWTVTLASQCDEAQHVIASLHKVTP